MFNLLPKTEKEAIRREYRIRLATVVLWFSFATLVIGSLLLLPSWFLSAQKEKVAQSRFDALSQSIERRGAAGLEGVLLATKKQLELLAREAPKGLLYELIGAIASRRPKNISFESITVTDRSGEKRGIAVTGLARDRDSLVLFSRALEGLPFLERVELPLSSLAKESDIPFSLNVTASF